MLPTAAAAIAALRGGCCRALWGLRTERRVISQVEREKATYMGVFGVLGLIRPCENVFLLYVDTIHSIWSHKYCSG
jgi:hypothetical protein